MEASLRPATTGDLDAINDIYNYYVRHSTATFDEQPTTGEQRRAWWTEHEGRFPVFVAALRGQIAGWASLSPYKSRCAYRFTVEDSVYLRPELLGRGVGHALLAEVLEQGRAAGLRSVLALIEAGQAPSIRLHARLGFEQVGCLRQVGFKFGRWLDVVFMQKLL